MKNNKYLTIVLFISIITINQSFGQLDNKNLIIEEIGSWEIQMDTLGSSIDTGANLVSNFILKMKCIRAKQTVTMDSNNLWPYVQLSLPIDGKDLDTCNYLYIEYQSTHDLAVGLAMESTINDGSAHRCIFPASNNILEWNCYTIKLEESKTAFLQPWAANEELKLSLVNHILIHQDIDDYDKEQVSEFKIRKFKFLIRPTKIKTPPVGKILKKNLTDAKQIRIFNFAGKLIASFPVENKIMTFDYTKIGSMASGCYIAHIITSSQIIKKRFVVQR